MLLVFLPSGLIYYWPTVSLVSSDRRTSSLVTNTTSSPVTMFSPLKLPFHSPPATIEGGEPLWPPPCLSQSMPKQHMASSNLIKEKHFQTLQKTWPIYILVKPGCLVVGSAARLGDLRIWQWSLSRKASHSHFSHYRVAHMILPIRLIVLEISRILSVRGCHLFHFPFKISHISLGL